MFTIIGVYLFMALSYYAYAVVKNYEAVRFWRFKPVDGYVGVCKYPKWLLFWLEWAFKKE